MSNGEHSKLGMHMEEAQPVPNDVTDRTVVGVQRGTGNRSTVAGATRSYAKAARGNCSNKSLFTNK